MAKLRYLLPLGLIALLAARAFGDAFAAAPLMIWIGLVIAARLRPSLGDVVRDRRPPDRGEIGAALLGLLIAYLAFGAADQAITLVGAARFGLATGGSWRAERWAPQALGLLWLAVALAPAAAHGLRRAPDAVALAREGLLGALPLGLVLFLAWQMAGRDWVSGTRDAELGLRTVALPPLIGLLGALGGVVWLRALRPTGEGASAFDWALRGAFAGWSCAGAAALILLVTQGARGALVHGLGFALAWSTLIAGVWLSALAGLKGVAPASPARAAAGLGVLALAFLVSGAPARIFYASGRTEIGDASGLVFLLLSPLWFGLALLCWKAAPRVVRGLVV